jgi:hypothetical protein
MWPGGREWGGHTREPILERGEVGRRRRLAGLEDLDGAAGVHGDGEAGGACQALLRAGEDGVEFPLVEEDFLAPDAADAIDDQEGFRGDALDQLGQALQVAEHARRGIHVRDGHELVLLLLQRLLDLGQLGTAPDGRFELRNVRAVGLEAVGEGAAEVAGVKDESVVAGLGEVGGDEVPAESA